MPTIEELAEPLGKLGRASVKAELRRVGDALMPGEEPLMLGTGQYEGIGNSLLIVTEQRLVAMNETGAFSKKLITRDIRFDQVTDVQVDQGIAAGTLMLLTAGGSFQIKTVLPQGRATDIANHVRQRMGTHAPTSSASAPATLEERLQRAKAMLDSGVIDDAEYQAMRARILAEA